MRVGLCGSLSCCQARWLLSVQEEEERWKEKREGGSSEPSLTGLEWPVPRAATSGDHLQLAQTASSLPSSFPHAYFLTPKWGKLEALVAGLCLARLCACISATFSMVWVEEVQEKQWRWQHNNITKYHFFMAAAASEN
ncbi:hypothetical protein ILYODFUR_007251 [Ilyodon furcidens]|uniref:Uncharacterized protein n=1 Tax=Ilyodon furcidens TaxID=33524 RepID=A0ABV0UPU6_9TELE